MANMGNLVKQVNESVKYLPDGNYMLGRTLTQPFRPANSGSRALMASLHREHAMVLLNPEVPIIQTGQETEFGEHSTSFVAARADFTVIDKIYRFDNSRDHYYMIIQYDDGVYDMIERTPYNHNTESYGYKWDNGHIDLMKPGYRAKAGETLKTSIGFDEYGNKMDGVNLLTLYVSKGQNMEDSIEISESASKKLATALFNTTSITINDNDVLLNMYGNENLYKTFPDIGEHTKDNIFCAIRRFENENMLYSLSQSRLREPMISDRTIMMNGVVADIEVYCNNPEALGDSYYNQQLFYYYNQRNAFCQRVVDAIAPIAMNGRMTYNLKKLYANCRDSIGGKQFFKDKQFSNVIMEITIIEELPMSPGDKMCDRYGGKGVVSAVVPDNMMPVLDNGLVVEVVKNQSTCINRENIGQLHEQSLSFIGMRLMDAFRFGDYSYKEMAQLTYKFIRMVDVSQAVEFKDWTANFEDEWACKLFMDSILEEDDAIIVSTPAFTTPVTLDRIAQIYEEFGDLLQPYTVYIPMEDSNGNIRHIPAKRPLVCGRIYNYRLKQYAEEKFSVTSLSATNLKGLNTRSKANKIYETKYTKTPIMFGNMESADMAHIGMQYVVMNLMLYSSSPQARRLFEQLLIGDPYNINIKLDINSKNRNAEIINALFKTMGIKLVFRKVPKKKKNMAGYVMCDDVSLKDFKYKTNIRDIIGHDGELAMHYGMATRAHQRNPRSIAQKVMCEVVEDGTHRNKTRINEIIAAAQNGGSESS